MFRIRQEISDEIARACAELGVGIFTAYDPVEQMALVALAYQGKLYRLYTSGPCEPVEAEAYCRYMAEFLPQAFSLVGAPARQQAHAAGMH